MGAGALGTDGSGTLMVDCYHFCMLSHPVLRSTTISEFSGNFAFSSSTENSNCVAFTLSHVNADYYYLPQSADSMTQ